MMENISKRVETLENLVEDLILILGRANQRISNLTNYTNQLEMKLQQISHTSVNYRHRIIS